MALGFPVAFTTRLIPASVHLNSSCLISVVTFDPSDNQTDRTRVGTLTDAEVKRPARAQNGQAKALSLTQERSRAAANVYPAFSV